MKKQISSTYLVAKYLIDNSKGKICDMKRVCKANNVGQRILSLRKTFKWKIASVLHGYEKGVAIWQYRLLKVGKMPKEYR